MIVRQIRTAEDVLTLTRQMQELWLQGHLKTSRGEERDEKLDGNVKAVANLLDVLIKRRDGALPISDGDGDTAMQT